MLDIVLITIGRRTGRHREAHLYAWPDGEQLVLVASGGGGDREPHWAGNLRAHPDAAIRRRRSTAERPMRAREVTEDPERERLWALAVDAFPYYERYQRRTARRIAVFVLEPRVDEAASAADGAHPGADGTG